jgi:parallel beta-helix repeat protein
MKGRTAQIIAFSLFHLFVFFIATASAECVSPDGNLFVSEDIELCSGEYDLFEGLTVLSDGLRILCYGTVFNGNDNSAGITMIGRKEIMVSGCTFRNFSMGGIIMQSSGINISNNSFVQSKNAGLGLSDVGSSYIDNCVFSKNQGNGITGINFDDSDITYNVFEHNTLTGLFLNSSDFNNIKYNDLYENTVSGIQLISSSYSNITYNNFSSNGKSGLTGSNMVIKSTELNRIYYNIFENSGVLQQDVKDFCFDNNTYINSQPPPDIDCISFIESQEPVIDKTTEIETIVNKEEEFEGEEEPEIKEDQEKPGKTDEPEISEVNYKRFDYSNSITRAQVEEILVSYYEFLGLRQDEIDTRLSHDINNALKWTKGSLISKSILVSKNGTLFTTDIDISPVKKKMRKGIFSWSTVKEAIVFEYIDKEVIGSTDHLHGNFKVIKADPLMAWHFPNPEFEINLTYSSQSAINGSTSTMLFVNEELRWNTWILPIVIIPFIIVVYIHFNRYMKWN